MAGKSSDDRSSLPPNSEVIDRAARLFRALGDPSRLQTLLILSHGESSVGALVEATGEKFPTMSQRLRLLRVEGLVARRRDGQHMYYTLADRHVMDLLSNAIAHADELSPDVSSQVSNPSPQEAD